MKHEEYFNNLKLAQGKAAEEAQEEEMRQKRLLDEQDERLKAAKMIPSYEMK